MRGTVQWKIDDDDGQQHNITIPNTFYLPTVPLKLLSPQHWSQSEVRLSPQISEPKYITGSRVIELLWGENHQFCKTIPLSANSNVGTFCSVPGTKQFKAFRALMGDIQDDQNFENPVCCRMVRDEEDVTAFQDFGEETKMEDWFMKSKTPTMN
mmetsp:Transcript_19728/g.29954  ORF Transcript_19728/g.29954 Transcript_19728/m.29954 type:complete len:154 (-) Transcript_19728:206-667(-)|eukprot:CAMPEP_0118681814 /NCGR_PEP_ID=MMETSP0800-20121206/5146_1 /TAXON_ID=210618 ORGANISM="Striatella unipunctata, Strain CCMP2910" /NCGR_SAMPLE_ID=MMETSP0800 /ASSEMBLY_ACC=CAM_ASM_000638 /LENGTH=153 /DNA_ID=CAMNT_0006578149 /DNA_START=155 /DNA_END=616 /DNA_ORIENTATION=+